VVGASTSDRRPPEFPPSRRLMILWVKPRWRTTTSPCLVNPRRCRALRGRRGGGGGMVGFRVRASLKPGEHFSLQRCQPADNVSDNVPSRPSKQPSARAGDPRARITSESANFPERASCNVISRERERDGFAYSRRMNLTALLRATTRREAGQTHRARKSALVVRYSSSSGREILLSLSLSLSLSLARARALFLSHSRVRVPSRQSA